MPGYGAGAFAAGRAGQGRAAGPSPTAWSSRTGRWCWPGRPTRRATRCCPLRAAAAAAEAGLPLAPRTLARLKDCPPLPVPWPPGARDALATLLGTGPAAIGVWEALDQEGMLPDLIPDWDRVRNRPQRNPLHTFTVDRHLVETAARMRPR